MLAARGGAVQAVHRAALRAAGDVSALGLLAVRGADDAVGPARSRVGGAGRLPRVGREAAVLFERGARCGAELAPRGRAAPPPFAAQVWTRKGHHVAQAAAPPASANSGAQYPGAGSPASPRPHCASTWQSCVLQGSDLLLQPINPSAPPRPATRGARVGSCAHSARLNPRALEPRNGANSRVGRPDRARRRAASRGACALFCLRAREPDAVRPDRRLVNPDGLPDLDARNPDRRRSPLVRRGRTKREVKPVAELWVKAG